MKVLNIQQTWCFVYLQKANYCCDFIIMEFCDCRHPSHWGKVCFLSTPDGENCGLVKNLAVTGLVSLNTPESMLPQLFDCGMEELVDDASSKLGRVDKVFLNGDWVGVCANSALFVANLRNKRQRNELPPQVNF